MAIGQKQPTKHESIVDDLSRKIRAGTLQPGQRIEPIRILASHYGTSINPVERALKELVRHKVLRCETRRGHLVAPDAAAAVTRVRRLLRRGRQEGEIVGDVATLLDNTVPATTTQMDWFISPILETLQYELSRARYRTAMSFVTEATMAHQCEYLQSLGNMLEALVMMPGTWSGPALASLADLGVPRIWVAGNPSARRRALSDDYLIMSDDTQGVAEGVAYLAELGHRRIALITQDMHYVGDRIRGYRLGLDKAGLGQDPKLEKVLDVHRPHLDVELTRKVSARRMRELLESEDPPTAVFCTNDLAAFGVIDCLRERSLRIGVDVSVLGYDDVENEGYRPFGEPVLTTLRKPRREMGRAAAKLILDGLQGPTGAVMIVPELVMRTSCGPHLPM